MKTFVRTVSILFVVSCLLSIIAFAQRKPSGSPQDDRPSTRFVRHPRWLTASIEVLANKRRAYTTCIETFRIRAFFLIIELIKYVASHRSLDARLERRRPR